MESSFSLLGSQFPPGYRFHPTDQELIIHYLRKKVSSSLPPSSSILITDINIYKFNPWELPEKAFFGEGEWFFFSPRDRKYPNGVRPNRAAACGYWKATGTDKPILATGGSQCLGVKKALVFYKGRPPKGIKTEWVMHEYRLINSTSPVSHKQKGTTMRLDDWVLCRVRKKGSLLPENDGKPTPATSVLSEVQGHERQQVAEKERSSLLDLSDCPLLGYLLGSATSEAESTSKFSDLFHGGSLDELMMLHPGQKSSFQFPEGEQLSPTQSGLNEQDCLGFLMR